MYRKFGDCFLIEVPNYGMCVRISDSHQSGWKETSYVKIDAYGCKSRCLKQESSL